MILFRRPRNLWQWRISVSALLQDIDYTTITQEEIITIMQTLGEPEDQGPHQLIGADDVHIRCRYCSFEFLKPSYRFCTQCGIITLFPYFLANHNQQGE